MFKNLLYKKTFDRIFADNYQRLYLYALHITGDTEQSRDIVSDVFTSLWKNISSLHMDTLNAYLLTGVRNRCVDSLRHNILVSQYSEEYLHTATEFYSDYSEEMEKDELVKEMLAQLPPLTRDILEKCYLYKMKYAEVAEELHISPDTVKKHISKALRMLKELYTERKKAGGRTPSANSSVSN